MGLTQVERMRLVSNATLFALISLHYGGFILENIIAFVRSMDFVLNSTTWVVKRSVLGIHGLEYIDDSERD